MQHATIRSTQTPPSRTNDLKRAPLLKTCTLPDGDVRRLLSLFRRSYLLETEFKRYTDAKAELQQLGGTIRLVDTERKTQVEARLELPTANPKIDDRIYNLVVGMGFDLRLQSKPGEQAAYVVTERASHDVSNIADMAQALVRLAKMLDSAEYKAVLAKGPPAPYVPPEMQEPEKRSNVVLLRKAS